VGDTVWLAREVRVPAGWHVRAGKLDESGAIGSLGDAGMLRAPDGWVIRYPVVWTTGMHTVLLPPVWRLAPDGHTDSLPGGAVQVDVRSVIPDSVKQPQPRSAIAPLRPHRRNPVALLLAILASTALLAGVIAWRRRPARHIAPPLHVPLEGEVPDARWLAAGEPKAVAARAAGRLRVAIARAHPRASLYAQHGRVPGRPSSGTGTLPDIALTRRVTDALTRSSGIAFASATLRADAGVSWPDVPRTLARSDAADRFARPFAPLLAALPAWWWLRARRLARLSGTAMGDVRPAEGAGDRQWVARLPLVLRSVCLAAWIIAAAGLRLGGARAEVRTEGISIVLSVDVSSSMLAEDFAPSNRIDVAKQTAIEFVRARNSDRIGLVAFAAQALTQVPITTDYPVLEAALQGLRIGMLEDGTAIGTGIATAANRLRHAPGKTKVLILLTDGVNNRGIVDPRTAAQAAAAFGIRIYTIGVGTRGEAPVPTGVGPEGVRYQSLPVEIDEPLLTEIATMTGGRYFRAIDTQSLKHIFGEIDRLEKSTVQRVIYRRFDETYRWPLGLGLLALGLEIVLSATFAVRVP
jgi:Ca-activated chloride channel family protein